MEPHRLDAQEISSQKSIAILGDCLELINESKIDKTNKCNYLLRIGDCKLIITLFISLLALFSIDAHSQFRPTGKSKTVHPRENIKNLPTTSIREGETVPSHLELEFWPLSGRKENRLFSGEMSSFEKHVLTGRAVLPSDAGKSILVADTIFWADYRKINSYGSLYRRGNSSLPSKHDYSRNAKIVFEDSADGKLAKELIEDASGRDVIVFSGGWKRKSDQIERTLVAIYKGSYASEHSFVDASLLAEGSLYIPYLTNFGELIWQKSVKNRNRPIVVVDGGLFFEQAGDNFSHRELYFDPRVDLKVIDYNNSGKGLVEEAKARLLEFGSDDVSPATIKKILGCCVYVRPPVYEKALVEFLASIKFNAKKTRIALMISDSATNNFLKGEKILSGAGRSDSIADSSLGVQMWLKNQLKKARNGTLLLISHVEGVDYVVRDVRGDEVGRISIQKANEMALENNVALFNLGCKTAEALHAFDGLGVFDKFNSIYMLKAISKAFESNPKSIAEFLERLGTPEARILVPDSFRENPGLLDQLAEQIDVEGIKSIENGNLRVPAVDIIISPNERKERVITGLSIDFLSVMPNLRGNHPIIAQLQIPLNSCDAYEFGVKNELMIEKHAKCTDWKRVESKKIDRHLFGHPERKIK